MAKYPIKMLLDEKKQPFFPVVTIDTVLVNESEKTAADLFAERYTKAEVDKIIEDLGTLQRLRGKVNSYNDLLAIENPQPGDTYIVLGDKGNHSEYMYIGDTWEELGPMIDLSGYDTSDEVDAKLKTQKDNLTRSFESGDTEILRQAKQYADTVAASATVDLSNYYNKQEVDAKVSNISGFTSTEMQETDYENLTDKDAFDLYILERDVEITETTELLLASIIGEASATDSDMSEAEALTITSEIIGGVADE